jgi:phage host-nuclease inhibitor protein Gam
MELKLDNKGLINELYLKNIENNDELIKLEEQMTIIKNEILHNKKRIQEICEHKYERVSEYGERTHMACYKCGLNT